MASGGGNTLPRAPEPVVAETQRAESEVPDSWLAAVKDLQRFALSLPILAFLIVLFPGDPTLNATLGPLTYKPISGLRDLSAVILAMLLVKLARDAYRISAYYGTAVIDLEFSDKIGLQGNIAAGYTRPIDLLRKRGKWRWGSALRRAVITDRLRTALMAVIFVAVSLGTLGVLLASIFRMARGGNLGDGLSLGLAVLTAALVIVAAADLWAIVQLWARGPGPNPIHVIQSGTMEAAEKLEAKLRRPLLRPSPWPPNETKDLNEYFHEVRRQAVIEECEDLAASFTPPAALPTPWPPSIMTDPEAILGQLRTQRDNEEIPAKRKWCEQKAAEAGLELPHFWSDEMLGASEVEKLWVKLKLKELYEETKSFVEAQPAIAPYVTVPPPDADGWLSFELDKYREQIQQFRAELDEFFNWEKTVDWCNTYAAPRIADTREGWAGLSERQLRRAIRETMLSRWRSDGTIWSPFEQAWVRPTTTAGQRASRWISAARVALADVYRHRGERGRLARWKSAFEEEQHRLSAFHGAPWGLWLEQERMGTG
jgi:hypothetical protein